MFSSFSRSVPLFHSAMVATGHTRLLPKMLMASGTLMMISLSLGLAWARANLRYSRPAWPIRPAT